MTPPSDVVSSGQTGRQSEINSRLKVLPICIRIYTIRGTRDKLRHSVRGKNGNGNRTNLNIIVNPFK